MGGLKVNLQLKAPNISLWSSFISGECLGLVGLQLGRKDLSCGSDVASGDVLDEHACESSFQLSDETLVAMDDGAELLKSVASHVLSFLHPKLARIPMQQPRFPLIEDG